MVIVDLWICAANEIYIMKKKLGPISVVLDCYSVQEPIIATRC